MPDDFGQTVVDLLVTTHSDDEVDEESSVDDYCDSDVGTSG